MSELDEGEQEKALDIIRENKIFRVKDSPLDMYIVSGSTDEYLVMSEFCTCDHFIIRCLKEPGRICYHILASRMANNVAKEIEVDWMDYLTREH